MAGFGDEVLIISAPRGTKNLGTHGAVADGEYIGGMGTIADTSHNGKKAFSFDGNNDALRGVLASGLGFPRTFGGWFKINAYSLASRLFVAAGSGDAVSIVQSSIAGNIWCASETTSQLQRSFGIGSWGLIVGVFTSPSDATVYINGEVSPALSGSSTAAQGNVPDNGYSIGARWDTQFCSMLADDLRVVPRALTPTEIAEWYAAGRGYNLQSGAAKKRRILSHYYQQSCS